MRELLMQVLEALQLGRDCAYEHAQHFHSSMAGYKPKEHEQVDNDVKQIDEAVAVVQAKLAEPCLSDEYAGQLEEYVTRVKQAIIDCFKKKPVVCDGALLVPTERYNKLVDTVNAKLLKPSEAVNLSNLIPVDVIDSILNMPKDQARAAIQSIIDDRNQFANPLARLDDKESIAIANQFSGMSEREWDIVAAFEKAYGINKYES